MIARSALLSSRPEQHAADLLGLAIASSIESYCSARSITPSKNQVTVC